MTLQGSLLTMDIEELTDLIPAELEHCSCCGDIWLGREMGMDYTGESVCEACIGQHYTYCNGCGEWVHETKIERIGEYRYCPDCAPEHWRVAG